MLKKISKLQELLQMKTYLKILIASITTILLSSFLFSMLHANSQEPLRLTLDSSVLVGTTNNILLQTIHSKKETFKMLVTEKWRNYLPRVGVSYFGLKNLNINQTDSAYNDVRLTVQQLLYDGGDTGKEVEIAKLQEISNAEDFKIAKEKLTFEIRKSYLEALLAGGKLYLVQKSYERILSQFSDIQAFKKTGFATDLQSIELNSKFREVELAETRAKGQYRQALFLLKQILNLDPSVPIALEENPFSDFLLNAPDLDVDKLSFAAASNKEEIKKSRISVEILKKVKEKSDNYWQPKISMGAYAGQNVNGLLPVKNDVYGFNFTISTQIGSNTAKSNGNYGVQTDGSGIQRIPGYGTQSVGKGNNSFDSADIHLWDDLSYSRKILENEIQLEELIGKHKILENDLRAEVYKTHDKLLESWYSIRIANSRVYLQYEALKVVMGKVSKGFMKKTDLISAELDFVKAEEELADALINYAIQAFKLTNASNIPPSELNIIQVEKGKGNSILLSLNPRTGGLGFIQGKDIINSQPESQNENKTNIEMGKEKKERKKKGLFYDN